MFANPFCLLFAIIIIAAVSGVRRALPQTRQVVVDDNGQFAVLSSAEISLYRPYTHYAGAAYCPSAVVLSWSCGPTCDANPSFKPVDAGGDGSSVQYWYVGYDSSLKSVIVAHQGTDPKSFMPVLTDVKIKMTNLDSQFFPGFPSQIKVHDGFSSEHLLTAPNIFTAVKKAIAVSGYNNVTIIGHSLGAALALLDSVYLPVFIPDAYYTLITYGLPRVGNSYFAAYVDRNVNLTRITNKKDPVPIVPGIEEGFAHPEGERHIHLDGTWIFCPGQDNPDPRCTRAEVPNVQSGNVSYHDGPYDGVLTNCYTNATNATST